MTAEGRTTTAMVRDPGASLRPDTDASVDRSSGWWHRPFRTFQTNLREVDADLDVERTLDAIAAHGADTWLLNTGGILSWYPTDLPYQERNPHLASRPGGDLLGDAVSAAGRRGIRVLSRMDFSKVVPRIAAAHPEWCFVGPTGDGQEYEGLVSVCPSGGYYQDHLIPVLDEVLDRYPVAGFFCNWFGYNEVDYSRRYHGVCHCGACIERYAHEVGESLPTGPADPGYVRWQEFARSTIDDLTTRIAAHVATRRSDAVLVQGARSDIVFHEANNAVGRPLWPHATGEAVSAIRSSRPEAPIFVNAVSFVDMLYRMAPEQGEHLALYLTQAISRGANPSTYIMGPPERIEYPGLEAAAEITRFHARHDALYAELRPAARVALVRPGGAAGAERGGSEALKEFRGLHLVLQERQVPVDIVPQELLAELEASALRERWDLLILPDLKDLGAAAVTVDAYAEVGGSVLATGATGLDAEGRQMLKTSPTRSSGEPPEEGDALRSSYARSPEGLLMLHGVLHDETLVPGAETLWTHLPPAPFGPPEKAYGHEDDGTPVLALVQSGRGRHLRAAWTVGRAYLEVGTTDLREALLAALSPLLPRPEVLLEGAPEQVEVVHGTSQGKDVLHLLNLSGVRRASVGPALPIRGIRLRVRRENPPRVRALVADVDCPVRLEGDDYLVELPTFGAFEVLCVDRT